MGVEHANAQGTTTTTTTHTTVETSAPVQPAPTPVETAQAVPEPAPAPAAEASIELQAAPSTQLDTRRPMWFFGGQFRHHWVPTGVQSIFMDMAPNIKGNGFGVIASRRNVNGFSLTFGLAYADYAFEGFFREKGDDLGETEFVRSDMSFWHLTSSFMWSAEFLQILAFEFGFGIDLGLVLGDINRTEAYADPVNGWQACAAAGDHPELTDRGVAFCDEPQSGNATDPSDERGAHYNVNVGKISGGGGIPDLFLAPAIPQLAIRIMPIKNIAIRLEAAYGIVQFWVGASLLVGFEVGEVPQAPPPAPRPVVARTEVIERRVEVAPPPVVAPPPPAKGRVKGTVWNEAGQRAVVGATVKLIGMELSAIVSADDGTFTTYELDPGLVTFEITHPDYETATCAATIPQTGGDVNARCVVVEKPRKGNISGAVVGARNAPVAGAQVQLIGPSTVNAVSDAGGTFQLDQVTPGTYAVRVEAEGYLVKLDQLEVIADNTARPQLVLTEKPKRSVVDLRENEIVITKQINFVTNKATIRPDAEPILVEVADVMLRNPQIQLIEIQGHTDDRGRPDRNMTLSQERAESVRQWLLGAGIAADRFEARGYGQTQPIDSNKTATGRTKNRRVQFIIRRQVPSQTASE
jgi:outer membrane protein OmpA-like peptidoglycan-associated protein